MKRIKTYVPVILEFYDDDMYEMQLLENSVSTEIEHLESLAYDAYLNGDFEILDEGDNDE